MKSIAAGEITFQYDMSDAFNNVSQKTSYKARLVSDDSKINDDLSMLDDDKSAFEANLSMIMADIYERLVKLTSGVDKAYSISDMVVTIKIQNNASYNPNVVDVVDASIYKCLETGSMKEWYSVCGKTDFEAEYAIKYNDALKQLSNRIFQLKKKTIKNMLGDIQQN